MTIPSIARGALVACALVSTSAHAGATPRARSDSHRSERARAYDWSGFHLGLDLGDSWGRGSWTSAGVASGSPLASGSFSLSHAIDTFNQSGSFFGGLRAGYDHMLPDRMLIGGEADISFPSFPNLAGISVGGGSGLTTPSAGIERYSENLLDFGGVRIRIGYAPGAWLLYGTGGLAFAYDQLRLQPTDGATESPLIWRLGWTIGAGIARPIVPHWTVNFEYAFSHYGRSSAAFADTRQRFDSALSLQQLRLGLTYRFGGSEAAPWANSMLFAQGFPDLALHGQATLTYEGNAAFHSPYAGPNSLPGAAEAREVTDASLFAGARLWQGAELWINPALDQGFGLANTHGVAGFPSAQAYKFGAHYPYALLQRYFIRQTIDLGGELETVEAGSDQFAGTQAANRLVLTLGSFAVTDLFDTNEYANSSTHDFLNWSLINAGTFDYAGNAWGYTDGFAAQWYEGRYAVRAGIFDLSTTPAGGVSPSAYGLDPSFDQFQWVGELEERHRLRGEPGDIKVTGFLSRGRAGRFGDAIDLAAATGESANINAVRRYTSRPGVSLNLEQQVTTDLGMFARAGWADGSVEPWDFADIDRTFSGGISLAGAAWGRPQDAVGAGIAINGISRIHQEFLNDGGLGLLIGDGKLPHPGLEKILETYYRYALLPSTHLSFDYQLIDDPAYNADRGPVNIFTLRVHWQF
ncbi:MAG: carbohydrate porin [Steroidobacteraceae bacterium]